MGRKSLITRSDYMSWKDRGEKIVMLTAYDAAFAGIMNSSGVIDVILVGDSMGMVIQGHTSTREVRMEDMLYHTEIVGRSAPDLPIIGDMPYHTFDTPDEALQNAGALIDAGADGVKIEGNKPEVVRKITAAGIPLIGHLGLLPQTATEYKVQAKDEKDAEQLVQDAIELQDYGAAAIVLEAVPRSLAARVTGMLQIPTIGIGAGPDCDGQVLVMHDMLGLTRVRLPKFVKQYARLDEVVLRAFTDYSREVKNSGFPSDEYSYH